MVYDVGVARVDLVLDVRQVFEELLQSVPGRVAVAVVPPPARLPALAGSCHSRQCVGW